jgi:hypothetical protein
MMSHYSSRANKTPDSKLGLSSVLEFEEFFSRDVGRLHQNANHTRTKAASSSSSTLKCNYLCLGMFNAFAIERSLSSWTLFLPQPAIWARKCLHF